MTNKSTFAKLNALDVSANAETKGKFTYLSWTWAVQQLRMACPDATWEVMRFDGKPFLSTECGYFVEVAVTVDGVTLSQIHPVLDNRNQPIAKPNTFQINTSIMRCLVKAIALHGLGLYIYAGEDLPEAVKEEHAKAANDLSAHRKAISSTLQENFSGDVNAIMQWLQSNGFKSVKMANEEELEAIKERLSA